MLERLHRDPGGEPEGALRIPGRVEAEAGEPALDVGYRRTDVVLAEREDVAGQDGQR